MKWIKSIALFIVGFGAMAIIGSLAGEAVGERIVKILEND